MNRGPRALAITGWSALVAALIFFLASVPETLEAPLSAALLFVMSSPLWIVVGRRIDRDRGAVATAFGISVALAPILSYASPESRQLWPIVVLAVAGLGASWACAAALLRGAIRHRWVTMIGASLAVVTVLLLSVGLRATAVAPSFALQWLAAATGVLILLGSLGLALLARSHLGRLRRGRTGIVRGNRIHFDDGGAPRSLPTQGRVRPGPAVATKSEQAAVRVTTGLRGEAIMRFRDRVLVGQALAIAVAILTAAPLLSMVLSLG
ncbi:MAG: hypothetical protein AAGF12_01870 [Myxococcota bacterium]